jgi:methionyl-tRNA formyltransferase
MAGDKKTGMMVMKMDKGLDTGPVALTREIDISPDMTGGELHDRLMHVGARAMAEAMVKLEMGDLPLTEQSADGVLYAAKIDKSETRIEFSRDAADVHNHIRGLAPFPGAWFELAIGGKAERVKVLGSQCCDGAGTAGALLTDDLVVACGTGAVRLTRLQKAGGKPLAAADFLRGTPLPPGTRLA